MLSREESSRRWPHEATHLNPEPKYSSIFRHLLGLSTMTRDTFGNRLDIIIFYYVNSKCFHALLYQMKYLILFLHM